MPPLVDPAFALLMRLAKVRLFPGVPHAQVGKLEKPPDSSPGVCEFDSRPGYYMSLAQVGKLEKPPDLSPGVCGFESHLGY